LSKNYFSQIWNIIDIQGRAKKKILLYSWLPTRTHHKYLAIWKFFLQNLANLTKNFVGDFGKMFGEVIMKSSLSPHA
jgi:hypothetical protein